MSMITLSTPSYDLDGHIVIKALASSSFGDISRRINAVKTLDGGIAINDGGTSHGDRVLSIIWRTLDPAFEENIERLVEFYPRLYVSTRRGYFKAAPQNYAKSGGLSTLTLQVEDKIA